MAKHLVLPPGQLAAQASLGEIIVELWMLDDGPSIVEQAIAAFLSNEAGTFKPGSGSHLI